MNTEHTLNTVTTPAEERALRESLNTPENRALAQKIQRRTEHYMRSMNLRFHRAWVMAASENGYGANM